MNIQHKKKILITQFLIGSFVLLLLISIGAFTYLGRHMSKVSTESIIKVGNLYMSGINDHITAHFRTLIDLKLEQVESVTEVVPNDAEDADTIYEELIYRIRVNGFNYLALCSEDNSMEMLYGDKIQLADPEPFFQSLKQGEKKVAVGKSAAESEVVMFGVSANYPMSDGSKSMAMITAVPIEYISAMLSTDEENALIFSHIIRKDGSFIVSDRSDEYEDYFSSLQTLYPQDDAQQMQAYIQRLSDAMEKRESSSTVLDLNETSQQIYCTPLPYSEWHLLTILPFGILNETIENMNAERTGTTMLVIAVILIVLISIFFIYFRITRQQLIDLEAARQEALAATKAKSTFLSNMSHDIRTPMNAIVGMTAIATAHIDDKEQVRNCLKKIALSGKHLLGLINDVLDMSKIESGKMTLTVERISLREVIEGIVSIVQTQVKTKNQSFNVHIDNIISEDVYCDSVRLNQILLNMLSNAVKYTQENGTIQLSLFQENLSEDNSRCYIRNHIVVKDNGIGMTQDFLNQIFDSYSRADSQRVQKTEGAGLGMAITKYIIDTMGGNISIKSEPNKGTEIHVILDLEQAETEETDMILPPWRMLVVDDDEILCHTAVEALKSIGIQAHWTLSGESALEMIQKQHQIRDDYQIVLLDWKLPGMDGLMVARQIRKIVGENMPIILISAYDWDEFEAEAREAGINGFISKPLFKSTLFHELKQYMGMEESEDVLTGDMDLAGCRLLAAEDNELNWEILNELLSDAGMELEWAENGEICLEKFKASEPGYYKAILMDVRMPVMNGYEATEAIRALERPDAQSIPIIAMTADAFSEDVKHCLDSGMNAHTAKPINLDELVALLKKFIL